MVFVDYLERGLKLSYEGIFEIDELYKKLTRWAKKHGYEIKELSYKAQKEKDLQKINVIWECKKDGSDYMKYKLDVFLNCANIKDIVVKNKKKQHGNAEVVIDSYVERDKEDVWSRKSLTRFLRETYDKLIIGNQLEEYKKEAISDVKALMSDLKAFFNTLKLKE